MIKKIVLRDVATFDSQGVVFDNLQRVNFVYGGNGSGKTTFSRVLGSKNREEEYPHCKVEWEGDKEMKVLVYNKDFRDRNLRENIPGVFTLGEASVEAMNEVEGLRKQAAELGKAVQKKRERAEKIQQNIKREKAKLYDELWEVFKQNQVVFEKCLDDIEVKEVFAKRMTVMVGKGSFRKAKEEEALRLRYRQLFENDDFRVLNPMQMPEGELASLKEIMADPVWKRCIVGSENVPIAKLIKEFHLDNWVKTGWDVVKKGSEVCPFCQQHTIDADLRQQLEEFFDVDYEQNLNQIRNLRAQYAEVCNRLVHEFLSCLYLGEQMTDVGEVRERILLQGVRVVDTELFRSKIDVLKTTLDTNARIMGNKQKKPAMAANFKKTEKMIEELRRMVEEANKVIAENNRLAQDIEAARNELKGDVWVYMASQCAGLVLSRKLFFDAREYDLKSVNDDLGDLQKEIKRLSKEIREREALMASIQPAINSINEALRLIGFNSFRIQPAKKGPYYQIQRADGSLATQTLSEGEMTFITFLYYMQLVKGSASKNALREPKVLVIDDPISSLDFMVTYVVSDMVKALLEEVRRPRAGARDEGIEQVFVLSHHVGFYRSVSFANKRANRRRDTHFWVLRKHGNKSNLRACGQENTIIEGYEKLWQDLRDSLERMDNRGLQNTMRTIIETYFVNYGGYDKHHLIPDHFSDSPEQLAIVNSLASWADEGSHAVGDPLYSEAAFVMNEKYMEVFRLLFVKLGHEAHFNMMMRVD